SPSVSRRYKYVFFGTCIDYEALALQWCAADKELLLCAAQRVLSEANATLLQALVSFGVQSYDLPRLHDQLDLYTRGKERVELLRAMPSGEVDIWGEGPWKKYLPHHRIHPPIDFSTTLSIMQQAQVVLNSSPRFKKGAHERILYALLCGASVYTSEN